jgi:hypothetical protein
MPIRWLRAIEKTIAALLSRKIQFFKQYASRAKGLGPTGMGHLYCGQALPTQSRQPSPGKRASYEKILIPILRMFS